VKPNQPPISSVDYSASVVLKPARTSSVIGRWINPAAFMRCDLENTSHPFREWNQSLHLFIILGIRRLCARAPTGESRPCSSPLVGDITHKHKEETDKHLSGPPDSMIASQGT